jgi:hypothetical protein
MVVDSWTLTCPVMAGGEKYELAYEQNKRSKTTLNGEGSGFTSNPKN